MLPSLHSPEAVGKLDNPLLRLTHLRAHTHRSFHALDDQGSIYVWGSLGGGSTDVPSDGFHKPDKLAKTPYKLRITYPSSRGVLPGAEHVKFTSISCGRGHTASLDSDGKVWIFTRWGRPSIMTSDILNESGAGRVVQVECGWVSVAMLTASGKVYVIWPFAEADEFCQQSTKRDEELDKKAGAAEIADETKKVVPCTSIEILAAPLLLPDIPQNLPKFLPEAEEGDVKPIRLIKVAAGDQYLIGLTNQGHVLSIDLPDRGNGFEQGVGGGIAWFKGQLRRTRIEWVYVSRGRTRMYERTNR